MCHFHWKSLDQGTECCHAWMGKDGKVWSPASVESGGSCDICPSRERMSIGNPGVPHQSPQSLQSATWHHLTLCSRTTQHETMWIRAFLENRFEGWYHGKESRNLYLITFNSRFSSRFGSILIVRDHCYLPAPALLKCIGSPVLCHPPRSKNGEPRSQAEPCRSA